LRGEKLKVPTSIAADKSAGAATGVGVESQALLKIYAPALALPITITGRIRSHLARLSLFDGDWAPAAAGLQQGTTPFWTLAQDFVFLVLFSSCSGVICAMHNTDCRPVIVRIASCYWTFLTANAQYPATPN
jgi:hypothetical protein